MFPWGFELFLPEQKDINFKGGGGGGGEGLTSDLTGGLENLTLYGFE